MKEEALNKIKLLDEQRRSLEEKQSMLKAKLDEFNQQNKDLIELINKIKEDINSNTESIKTFALEEFELTGSKKMYGGIGIRVMQSIDYDKDKAFQWAKEHSLCLKLDDSAFKKIAKTQDIEFVTVTENPTVTFPSVITFNEE